jgi:hypothetical protein
MAQTARSAQCPSRDEVVTDITDQRMVVAFVYELRYKSTPPVHLDVFFFFFSYFPCS